MAANEYIRTVNITPLGTAYSWDTPPSWITISRVGTSDDWTITVAANTGSARSATLVVRHGNGSTTSSINVSQAGGSVVITPTPTPTSSAGAGPTPTPTSSAGAGPTPTPTSSAGAGPTPTPTSSAGAGPTPTPTSSAGAGPTPTPTRVVVNSGGGAGTCFEYTIYNEGGSTIAGTLSGILECGGFAQVGLYIPPGQSYTICTTSTAQEIEWALQSMGASAVTVVGGTSLCTI